MVTPTGHPPVVPRKLRRSDEDRVIAGVCGGLAAFTGVDAMVVRIAAVLLLMLGGLGAGLYLLAWLAMPAPTPHEREREQRIRRQPGTMDGRTGAIVFGAALIAVGAASLLDGVVVAFEWRFLGPLSLIVLGIVVLIRRGVVR